MSFASDIQQYSYDYLLNLALAQVPDTVDKREGSIIYDALAPACYVMANTFLEMHNLYLATSVLTAIGEDLENRCAEMGISRDEASPAVKKAVFTKADGTPATAVLGNRFSTISDTEPLIYYVSGPYVDSSGVVVEGAYRLTCETSGTAGHQYFGNLIPLDYLPNIAVATLEDILVPGSDLETDDELRARYVATVNERPFGGNIAEYKAMALDIEGVGGVQVHPAWNGGGTVKLSIIDSTHRAVSADFLSTVQNTVDPVGHSGQGIGLAPIDHRVTISTPNEVELSIASTVTLSGYALSQVRDGIEAAVETYIASIRKDWGNGSDLNEYASKIYISQINRAILSVEGVVNATNITINGKAEDLTLVETSTLQELPILAEVSLSVGS